jgi:hypothetical protein
LSHNIKINFEGLIFARAFSYIRNTNWLKLLLIPGILSSSCYAQNLKTIDLNEINQKKVRMYIKSRSIDRMNDFSSIHPSWNRDKTESDFYRGEKIFYSKYKLSDVWNNYRHANLISSWKGNYVRFGLLISKHSNSVTYIKSTIYPDIDTGQVYFLNLNILKGLFHIPVAFEIINIDPLNKILEFSYIDNNVSKGKQTLHFFDNGDGRTRIVHTSYFRSNSRFRDTRLYPYFHNRFIKEFHRNMGHMVKKV